MVYSGGPGLPWEGGWVKQLVVALLVVVVVVVRKGDGEINMRQAGSNEDQLNPVESLKDLEQIPRG